jgi:hypothetical protein
MSYAPCRFTPFDLPDYEPLPRGVELKAIDTAPNPFAMQRGTAQFAQPRTTVPINMPKVKANPPTRMSFATIQYPWAQFDLRYKAPCNVWSQHEVNPRPVGNMYGQDDAAIAAAAVTTAPSGGGVSNVLLAALGLAVGAAVVSSLLAPNASR